MTLAAEHHEIQYLWIAENWVFKIVRQFEYFDENDYLGLYYAICLMSFDRTFPLIFSNFLFKMIFDINKWFQTWACTLHTACRTSIGGKKEHCHLIRENKKSFGVDDENIKRIYHNWRWCCCLRCTIFAKWMKLRTRASNTVIFYCIKN